MKYSTMKQQVTGALMNFMPGEPSFDYPFFVGDLLTAADNQKKVNILPYGSEINPFTDTLVDFDYTPAAPGGMESITLIFQSHGPFTFVLNRGEVKQPQPAKYYVNHSVADQQINMRFNI